MDTITRLTELARLRAIVDKRCLLAGATRMDVAAADGADQAAFHVVLDGACTLELPGRTIGLKAGDAVLLTGSPAHTIRTAGGGPTRSSVETPGEPFDTIRSPSGETVADIFCGRYTVDSRAGLLLLRSLPDPLVVTFDAGDDSVRTLTELMRAEARSVGPGTAAVLNALSAALFAMMLRRSPSDLTGNTLWTAVGDPRIAAAVDAVLRDPGADWPVERLAEVAAMSRATFVRHFGRHTGSTVAAFVTMVRMMVAADLLTAGHATVAAVAGRVGYHSESAFAKAFREATGQTPGRFRRHSF
ncbi:cupin domain-containing protein [Kribbella sp. CA-247076]|uniref:cupin domain-containing protein n=1 Tax=Kribbella sp. CA-247076 TaxID=3239941 RepID=UPI003D9499F2